MRMAAFMSSFEAYESKLYELLSKAYEKEEMNDYRFILDFEMKQMLHGDIPTFSLNSLDYFLEKKKSIRIFEYSCIENICKRIDSLSCEHKEEQLGYITRWFNL
jgi:lantibiotic modifying enzyme